jgi:Type II secretion system (T2SS), protein G
MSNHKGVWLSLLTVAVVIAGLTAAFWFAWTGVIGNGHEAFIKLDIKNVEAAVMTYHSRHGKYPETLDQLARPGDDGSPAILKDKRDLIDRWDQPFRYDPRQQHPRTGIPLIWSVGPPGENKRFSNWDPFSAN